MDPLVRKIPGEGNGYPLQNSCLEIPRTEEPGGLHTVHGVTKSQTRLSAYALIIKSESSCSCLSNLLEFVTFFPLNRSIRHFLKSLYFASFHVFLGKFQSLEYFLALECS